MKHELDNVEVATQELGEFLNQSTGFGDRVTANFILGDYGWSLDVIQINHIATRFATAFDYGLNIDYAVVDHEELAQMVERVAEAARAELDTFEQEVEA